MREDQSMLGKMPEDRSGTLTKSNGAERHTRKSGVATLSTAAVGLIAASTLLAGCGSPTAVPMNDEYAGNAGESSSAPSQSTTDPNTTTSDKQDTGNYADGTYAIKGQYGPIGEDSIDVSLTVADQDITAVSIVGHPSSTISKNHQDAFSQAIPGVVVGKPLKDLKIDTVAGASWTSEAFNKALEVARQEASIGG